MGDDDATSWPDDEDPFAPDDEKTIESDESKDSAEDDVESTENESPQDDVEWSLPIRAAPIMALSGDEVQEFTLNESPNGLSSTSLVVNEDLIRIVESNYGDDGQRRLNVKIAMKHELTGFSHNHNELMHKHQWLWIGAFIVGIGFSFIPLLSLFGQLLLGIGLLGWIYMHLEVHSLEFSANGSKHKIIFTGYGSNRPMFRASMALIGPTMAKYMETGLFDTKSIDTLHESLTKPPDPMPDPINTEIPPFSLPPLASPSEQIVQEEVVEQLPPPEPPQTLSEYTPPEELPAPAPPMPQKGPPMPQKGPPTKILEPMPPPSPPINNALPPATLPPPLPPAGVALPPPIGLGMPIDTGEIPLNAPLPAAPEITVKASPIEESLSPDEKNELLEELK